jgi:hypothetical protein
MEYDKNKVDSMVLALLYLTKFKDGPDWRTWKGHDWDTMDRLYAQGYISDPKSNAKSVAMTEEGVKQAKSYSSDTLEQRAEMCASAAAAIKLSPFPP